jgi:hypothetical protein
MSEESEFDPRSFFEAVRKSASVKAGAIILGESQSAYFDTLKEHMSEEEAFNMLAHTTECIIKGIATAAGPVAEALLQASYVWERMAHGGKEVPGS